MTSGSFKIRVPEEDIVRLQSFARTDKDFLRKLADILIELKPTFNIKELSALICEKTDLDINKTNELVASLWNWALIKNRIDISATDFEDGVSKYLNALPDSEWDEKVSAEWDERKELLVMILSTSNAITLGAKAIDLLVEQELVYRTSKIITDIRPVYDDNANKIYGFLPFHTLVVHCIEGGETKDLHITLDINDVIQLHKQLDRSIRKEKLIKSELNESNLNVIETDTYPDIPLLGRPYATS